jgi:hypothetical protein
MEMYTFAQCILVIANYTYSGISGKKSDPVYIAIRFELGNVTKESGVNE